MSRRSNEESVYMTLSGCSCGFVTCPGSSRNSRTRTRSFSKMTLYLSASVLVGSATRASYSRFDGSATVQGRQVHAKVLLVSRPRRKAAAGCALVVGVIGALPITSAAGSEGDEPGRFPVKSAALTRQPPCHAGKRSGFRLYCH